MKKILGILTLFLSFALIVVGLNSPATAKDTTWGQRVQASHTLKDTTWGQRAKSTTNEIFHVVDAGDWDPPIVIQCANGNRYNVYEGHSSKEFCNTIDLVYNYADSKIQVKREGVGSTDGWVDAYTLYGWQSAKSSFTKHRTVHS